MSVFALTPGRVAVVGSGPEGSDPALAGEVAFELRRSGWDATAVMPLAPTERAADEAARATGARRTLAVRLEVRRHEVRRGAEARPVVRRAAGFGLLILPFDFGRREIVDGAVPVSPAELLDQRQPLERAVISTEVVEETMDARLAYRLRRVGAAEPSAQDEVARGVLRLERGPIPERPGTPALDALRREAAQQAVAFLAAREAAPFATITTDEEVSIKGGRER